MKRSVFCLPLAVLILGACSAPHLKPEPSLLLEARRFLVVPVGVSAPARGQMDGWVLFSFAYAPEGDAGPALISDALSLFAEELEHENLPSLRVSDGGRNAWNPALALAREAATLISSASPYEACVREEQHTLPASGRSDPHSLLQEWYRANTSALNPAELSVGTETRVLELGLPDYALLEDRLLLRVLVKIVDPSTGVVVARAGNQASVNVGSPEQLFTHGGRKFKTVFAAEGRRLLQKNLQDIGILPKVDRVLH